MNMNDQVEITKKIRLLLMLKYLLSFFILLIISSLQAKILIFTYCYNRPDFVEMQYASLRKFIVNEFDYIVFNDACNTEMSKEIKNTCNKIGAKCIEIPQEIHSRPYLKRLKKGPYKSYNQANVRNSNVVQWSFDRFGYLHDDILILLDGDIFLTKKLDVRKFMEGYQAAAFLRPCYDHPAHNCKISHSSVPTVRYMWIGLVFLNVPKLPNKKDLNFNCGLVEKNVLVDAGGYTYNYLKRNPNVKVKSLSRFRTRRLSINQLKSEMEKLKFSEEVIKFAYEIKKIDSQKGIEFYMEDYFVHYFGGTNYFHGSRVVRDCKTKLFKKFLDSIISTEQAPKELNIHEKYI